MYTLRLIGFLFMTLVFAQPLSAGFLYGHVYDAVSEEPIEEIYVYTQHGFAATTDEEGYWEIRGALEEVRFDITASGRPAYRDSTLTDLIIEEDDSLEVNFGLLRLSELVPSDSTLSAQLHPGEAADIDFSLQNRGITPIEWQVSIRLPDNAHIDPWEMRHSYQIGEWLTNQRKEGVAFIDGAFYLSARDEDGNYMQVIDKEGDFLRRFPLFGEGEYGMFDLAWDGELIWGSGERRIYGFTPDGELEQSWDGPFLFNQAMAWDSERELLWISGMRSDYIAGCDRDGEGVDTLDLYNLNIFGMAYWHEDPDGYPLYILQSPDNQDQGQALYKMNPTDNDTMFVVVLEPGFGAIANGAFISSEFDLYSSVLLTATDIAAEDRIDVLQVHGNTGWLEVVPTMGNIAPDSTQDLILRLDATGLDTTRYDGELVLLNDGFMHEVSISVALEVAPLDAPYDGSDLLPTGFTINSVYPNPFNSTTSITYTLPSPSRVTLKLYSLLGREIALLEDSFNQAGIHQIVVDADGLPSGLYFVQLKASGQVLKRKVMLIR